MFSSSCTLGTASLHRLPCFHFGPHRQSRRYWVGCNNVIIKKSKNNFIEKTERNNITLLMSSKHECRLKPVNQLRVSDILSKIKNMIENNIPYLQIPYFGFECNIYLYSKYKINNSKLTFLGRLYNQIIEKGSILTYKKIM